MALLKTQEEAADLDSKYQVLECLGQEIDDGANSAPATPAGVEQMSPENRGGCGGTGGGDSVPRYPASGHIRGRGEGGGGLII